MDKMSLLFCMDNSWLRRASTMFAIMMSLLEGSVVVLGAGGVAGRPAAAKFAFVFLAFAALIFCWRVQLSLLWL